MPSITASLPHEVVTYCEEHNLLTHLEMAIHLAEECYSPIERLEVVVEPDPEVEGGKKVIVDVWVNLTVQDALKRQDAFSRRWVDSVPPVVIGEIVVLHHFV